MPHKCTQDSLIQHTLKSQILHKKYGKKTNELKSEIRTLTSNHYMAFFPYIGFLHMVAIDLLG